MTLPSDLEIAREAAPEPPARIAERIGIGPELVEPYGDGVAKIRLGALDPAGPLGSRPRAKYVVVTAVTPTPLGEGKTTVTVGLGDGLNRIGRSTAVAIRQPSMGPVFGIKGGAAGGGYSQVVPMERLNLHLTGDIHAVGAANNLLAALLDNHLYRGNALGIDPDTVSLRRALDVNDRALRTVDTAVGPAVEGEPRRTGFDITAASEVMALLALARSLPDVRERLGRIIVAEDRAGRPVTAEALGAAGAMAAVLREAVKPNLMQTLEHTPALVHTGPFGNIATGNSSVIADLIGLRAAEFLVTEAGFGADMGAERFFNIKCRVSGEAPDAAVVVATVRALKAHSGRYEVAAGRPLPEEMLKEDPEDVRAGGANLLKQIENCRLHGVTPVVAVNAFPTDHASEIEAVRDLAAEAGVRSAVCTNVADGGEGARDLAAAVAEAAEEPSRYAPLYPLDASLKEKVETVARAVYGASGVTYSERAERQLRSCERNGLGTLPVCIAKTHLSLSSDPALRGAPTGWTLPVREVRPSAGAGFVYLICGSMQTMPGLGRTPAALGIDLDDQGRITGLF
ncbi:formate--tetrahydrofolate ligase [Nocardiopsis potens]|uniref:formate--tetrahydrofolate ligase n=1 Tax=Nocardiopsis potens TaxID=1246458 RepID=UPI000373CEC6|nr:formate--tetrahydrofolate ligase [Nocardiopsis potens]